MKKKLDWRDWTHRIIFTIICLALAGIPTYFFFFLKNVLSPERFWQKFVVYGVGIWFLGVWQIVFLVLATVLVIKFWELY